MPERLLAHASAPLRVDCGGIVDVPLLWAWFARAGAVTVNIALSLRTHAAVFAHEPGVVRVESGDVFEEAVLDEAPLDGRFGTFFFLCGHFGVSGVRLVLRAEGPPRSGLGGSSAAAVAAAAALAPDRFGAADVARIAFAVERQLEPCGPQDHLAAAHGGASAWRWAAPEEGMPWERTPLPSPPDDALLVANTGEHRASATMLNDVTTRFVAGRDRAAWLEVVARTRTFADALGAGDLAAAGDALRAEAQLFGETWPQVYTDRALALCETAWRRGCGARFTGAGQGGCVWALGEPNAIAAVREAWSEACAAWPGATVLDARPDPRGVDVAA